MIMDSGLLVFLGVVAFLSSMLLWMAVLSDRKLTRRIEEVIEMAKKAEGRDQDG